LELIKAEIKSDYNTQCIKIVLESFLTERSDELITQPLIVCLLFVVLPKTNQLLPKCVLPRNMSGTWFTQGQQFKSDVFINDPLNFFFAQFI
jgi:hypothetical protein